MPDNHSPDSSTNDVNELLRLPDAEFAREFGLPVSDEGTPAATPETPIPSEAEAVEPAPPDEQAPEETPEPPQETPKEPLKLATQFTAVDESGEEYDLGELAKVKVAFKANGKDRIETFDKVVRLAQFGFHNEEVQRERDHLRGQVLPTLQEQLEAAEQKARDQLALNMRLLKDPDFYVETREQAEAQLTPEARAQAAEQRLAEIEQHNETNRRAQESVQFTATQIMPKLEALQQEYPSVTQEEILGMFTIATAPYARRGVVPKENWPAVARLIDGEIATRMASIHDARVGGNAKAEKVATAKVTKALEEATKAKRTLARAVKGPTTSGSAPARKSAPSRTIESAEDAIDSIMDEVVTSFKT